LSWTEITSDGLTFDEFVVFLEKMGDLFAEVDGIDLMQLETDLKMNNQQTPTLPSGQATTLDEEKYHDLIGTKSRLDADLMTSFTSEKKSTSHGGGKGFKKTNVDSTSECSVTGIVTKDEKFFDLFDELRGKVREYIFSQIRPLIHSVI
jgi:hypothetical protein